MAGRRGRRLYGPSGFGNLAGAPAEQSFYRPLRGTEDAARIWRVSEELTKVYFIAFDPHGRRHR